MSGETIRIDKWLWHSRLVKTRSLAARLCEANLVVLNGLTCAKPAHPVRPGDQIQLSHGGWRRVIELIGIGDRRGPSPEAKTLYREVSALRPDRLDPDWTPLLRDEKDEIS